MVAAAQSSSLPQAQIPCSGKHRRRLLIGEGNFTFALALINKHDLSRGHIGDSSLAHSIIATELRLEGKDCRECESKKNELIRAQFLAKVNAQLSQSKDAKEAKIEIQPQTLSNLCEYCSVIKSRREGLEKRGVTIILGVNGTSIHEHPQLKNQRFERIHWNIPHDGKSYEGQTIPEIIKGFLKSCWEVQKEGDRVYISIPQPPPKPSEVHDRRKYYQGYVYNLAANATAQGYVLIKKRKFGAERYPGYEHHRTNKNEAADNVNAGAREFVFEQVNAKKANEIFQKHKVGSGDQYLVRLAANELASISSKKYTVSEEKIDELDRCYYDNCSTDIDSSDYEDNPSKLAKEKPFSPTT